jgi:hypothetical protein
LVLHYDFILFITIFTMDLFISKKERIFRNMCYYFMELQIFWIYQLILTIFKMIHFNLLNLVYQSFFKIIDFNLILIYFIKILIYHLEFFIIFLYLSYLSYLIYLIVIHFNSFYLIYLIIKVLIIIKFLIIIIN